MCPQKYARAHAKSNPATGRVALPLERCYAARVFSYSRSAAVTGRTTAASQARPAFAFCEAYRSFPALWYI